MSSPYQIAKEEGYSEEEINFYLSKKNPNFEKKFQSAIEQGYDPEEIYNFLSKKQQPIAKESFSENLNRQFLRSGARGAETILGAPRAVGEFLESVVPEKLIKSGAEKIGLKKPVQKGFEIAKKFAPYKLFPKSEDIRENVTKKLFGKHLEPKNEWERKADETVSDFAALALPISGSKLKILKPALLAMGGNIASDVVGSMGGTDKEKTYAKLGTFLFGSMINPKAAETLKNDLYSKARENLPKDATVASRTLENSLNDLESSLRKGGIAGSDKEALQKIADVRNEMQGAQIPVDSLERLKVKINEAKSGVYKQLEGNKPGIKSAKRNLDMVGKTVDEALKLYGKQNPQWAAFYRPANEVHGAIAQSKRARKLIERVAKKYSHHAVLPLLGIGHVAGVTSTLTGLAAGVGLGAAAVTGGEIIAKISKSPTLRKHYTNLITAALKEDTVAIEENLKKLEKELKNED